MLISIAGLDEADVLAALYNAAYPHGLHFRDYDPQPMTRETARAMLARSRTPMTVGGRSIYVSFAGDAIETRAYDADKRAGYAAEVIESLRATTDANNARIRALHRDGVLAESRKLRIDADSLLGRKIAAAIRAAEA